MLKKLNKTEVTKKELPIKILQFGTGNFLRAFVDWMIEISNRQGITNHGIAVVQSTTRSNDVFRTWKQQDLMYHVCLEGVKDKQPIKDVTLVKNIMTVVNAVKEYEAYKELFLSPGLEIIISNTTEAGIHYEEGDDIFATPPESFPAKITGLLYQRYQKYKGDKSKGLSIVCTELIEDNGQTLKKYVLQHAECFKLESEFIDWVNSACSFYDTLVDRIVSGLPKENLEDIQKEIGFEDNLIVKGEYFHVWAIGGDERIKKQLPLDKAGLNVLFMDNITNFRAKKVRVLNGAHTAMVPVALQLGCQTVMEGFSNHLVEKYINEMVAQEVLPVIEGDSQELKKFASTILDRFYNPFLKHYLKDISLNSISKWEARDYPTVLDNHTKLNKVAKLAIFSFAALLVLYSGHAEIEFEPTDNPEVIRFIQSTFHRNGIEKWVSGIVHHDTMWNVDLLAIPCFVEEVSKGVEAILTKGMQQALTEII